MKGLVIDDPWISLILAGQKDWEMRSSGASYRGEVALIRKGSGRIVGLCTLTDSFGPLDGIAWRAHRSHHRIPESLDAAIERWPFAWALADVRPFAQSVPYSHPFGAVIWVNLEPAVIEACRIAALAKAPPIVERAAPTALTVRELDSQRPVDPLPIESVPFANDGTWFGPHLRKPSGFTIGRKGEERVVGAYLEALAQLRAMPKAYWRRPNAAGNWGIVAAVRWASRTQSTST